MTVPQVDYKNVFFASRCHPSLLPSLHQPTFPFHLLILTSEECLGYDLPLLCLSGSLLAYNTTSHTDQSSRLSVKEGKSVLSRA